MNSQLLRTIFFNLVGMMILGGCVWAESPAQVPTRSFRMKPIDAPKPKSTGKEPMTDIPKPLSVTVIDDFQDATLNGWWGFGDLLFSVVENSEGQYDPTMSGKSIRFQGKSKDQYIGGCGRVVGLDASKYNALKLVIKGNQPPKSGILIVELYPVLGNSLASETPERREWFLRYAHKYIYTITVDWRGWRVITIPFKDFLKDNPRVKQPLWDPAKNEGVGSLVQLQLLVLSDKPKGSADFQIDSISLVKDLNAKQLPGILDY